MSKKKERVVVTGIGAITALGVNAKELWSAVLQGTHGIRQVESVPMDGYMASIAGEVKQPLEKFEAAPSLSLTDRAISFALRAAQEALQSASLHQLPEDAGCVIGTCLGGAKSWERWVKQKQAGEQAQADVWQQVRFNGIAEAVSSQVGIRGQIVTISTACAAGGNAIGHAADLIRSGKASVVLAGGADALSILAVSGFHSLQSLSSEPCKPYSGDRDGLSLGEGAGILVLESEQHALARQANIYAEVLAFGLSADGYHPTAPHPEGEGAARAIRMALEKSGVQPIEVDYINGHGTGTPKNDSAETMAIKRALGEEAANRLKISSTKSMIGHLLGAAGAVEGIVTVLALYHNCIPPTANYTKKDPECDLDYTPNEAIQQQLTYAISNNFAFGGNNCSVVFRAYEPATERKLEAGLGGFIVSEAVQIAQAPQAALAVQAALDATQAAPTTQATQAEHAAQERVVITGIAQISAAGTKLSSFWETITRKDGSVFTEVLDADQSRVYASTISEYDSTDYISKKDARRMDTLGKLTVSVAMDALKDSKLVLDEANTNRIGVVFGTANGTMESLEQFYFPVLSEGATAANPAYFPNTVFNQAAGQVAMHTQARGVSSTVVDGHASFSSALCMAYEHIRNQDAEAIVAVAADTLTPFVISGYKDAGMLNLRAWEEAAATLSEGCVLGEGAVAVVVESLTHALARGATIYAEVLGYGRTFEPLQAHPLELSNGSALIHNEKPTPRGGLERAMQQALLCDSSPSRRPDAIFVAQSGIPASDKVEQDGISQLFPDEQPILATCKHAIGEVQGAANGFQMAAALLSMQKGSVPQIKEDASIQTIEADLERILVNGASLTGSYTSILLSKYK